MTIIYKFKHGAALFFCSKCKRIVFGVENVNKDSNLDIVYREAIIRCGQCDKL